MSASSTPPADATLGVVGLGVMGRNLALNARDHGVRVVAYDAYAEVRDSFEQHAQADAQLHVAPDVASLVDALPAPRTILLMVKAGDVVDDTIAMLMEHLDEGDLVIDGGNSHYLDTRRRAETLAERGFAFLGVGVSGGEEGARHGPSLMPGGDQEAYARVAPMLASMAARAPDGAPCIAWLGEDGAGHFVKMVHNGIEYADMQMIAEVYDVMRRGLALDAEAMSATFARWNEGPLESYLIRITSDILATRDATGEPLVDDVLDAAGEKGTGRWTAVSAFELGAPFTVVAEAVAARSVSARVEQRAAAAQLFTGPETHTNDDAEAVIADLHDALYGSKIVAYAQGLEMLARAAEAYGWSLDVAAAASIWRGGCIIRSRFLDDITAAYRTDPSLPSLLHAPFFADALQRVQAGWRRTVARAVEHGVAVPTLSAALAYFDGYRTARGPANLIQAQRDYFGAHTFERVSGARGDFEHFDWLGAVRERDEGAS